MRQMILTGIAVLFALTGGEIAQAQITSMSNCGDRVWNVHYAPRLEAATDEDERFEMLRLKRACGATLSGQEIENLISGHEARGVPREAARLIAHYMRRGQFARDFQTYQRWIKNLDAARDDAPYWAGLEEALLMLTEPSQRYPFAERLLAEGKCALADNGLGEAHIRSAPAQLRLDFARCYRDDIKATNYWKTYRERHALKRLADIRRARFHLEAVQGQAIYSRDFVRTKQSLERFSKQFDPEHPDYNSFHNVEDELCYIVIKQAYDSVIITKGTLAILKEESHCEVYIAEYDAIFRAPKTSP